MNGIQFLNIETNSIDGKEYFYFALLFMENETKYHLKIFSYEDYKIICFISKNDEISFKAKKQRNSILDNSKQN